MRNFLIATLVAMTAIFMSCNSSTSTHTTLPTLYTAGSDTTLTDSCQSFVQKEWKGKRCDGKTITGKSWKPAGYSKVDHTIRQQGPEFSQDSLQKMITSGGSNTSSDSSFNWMPKWLNNFLEFIWPWLLLAFILWLLWQVGTAMANNTNRMNRNQTPPANPGADGVEQNRQQYNPTFVTVVNEVPDPAEQVPMVQIITIGDNSPVSNVNVQIGKKHVVGYKPSDATAAKKAEAGVGETK